MKRLRQPVMPGAYGPWRPCKRCGRTVAKQTLYNLLCVRCRIDDYEAANGPRCRDGAGG